MKINTLLFIPLLFLSAFVGQAQTSFTDQFDGTANVPDVNTDFTYANFLTAYPSPLHNSEMSASSLGAFPGDPNVPASYRGLDASYSVIVGGNLTVPILGGSEIEGRAAVEGDFTLNKVGLYGVCQSGGGSFVLGKGDAATADGYSVYAMAVNGDLNINSGTLSFGSNSTGDYTVGVAGTINNSGTLTVTNTLSGAGYVSPIDVTGLLTKMSQMSTNMKNATAGGNINIGTTDFITYSPAALFTGSGTADVEVFNVTATQLNKGFNTTISFVSIKPGSTIIINVSGAAITHTDYVAQAGRINDPNNGTSDDNALVYNLVWNFYEATSITTTGDINGAIFAPNADLTVNNNINGRVYVGGNLTHSGTGTEIHNYPFKGDLSMFDYDPNEIYWDGTTWHNGSNAGVPSGDEGLNGKTSITILPGSTAEIPNEVIIEDLIIKADAELDVLSCLSVTGSTENNGKLRLRATSETSYGQYLGPQVSNLESQMVVENTGWHNIALPVTITATDFDTQNNTPNPNIIHLTGDAATHNLYQYNSGVSGGKEIGFYTGNYNSHAYGTWQMVSAGTLSGGYNLFIDNNNTSNPTVSLSATGLAIASDVNYSTTNAFGGWNLIPNPYPVSIDFTEMYNNGAVGNFFEDLDKAVWIWDASNTGNTQPGTANGSYVLYDPVTGESITNGGDLDDNDANSGYIPPFQSFWVRRTTGLTTRRKDADGTVTPGATADAVNAGVADDPDIVESTVDVTIKPEYRAICHSPKHYKTAPLVIKLRAMAVQNPNIVDETMLHFGNEYTDGFDIGFDIMRNASPQGAQFFVSDVEGKAVAINRLPIPTEVTKVPLSFVAENNGEAHKIAMVNAPANWQVYLEDKYTGAWHNLSTSDYEFNYASSFGAQRFILHFTNKPTTLNQTSVGSNAWGSQNGLTVAFNNMPSSQAEVTVSNLLGQVIYHNAAVNTLEKLHIPIDDTHLQVYVVHIRSGAYSKSSKVVR